MKRLLPVLMGFVVLLLSSTEGWSLPPCPERGNWNNCIGTYTYPGGDQYVGGWKDDKRNGKGTLTYADGRVEEGIWVNGIYLYARKLSPTVSAKKTPLEKAKEQCAEIGFKKGTEKFGDCVMKLLN